MSSVRSSAEVGSGSPSRLMIRQRSLAVRPFLSWGLLLVFVFAGAWAALAAMVVVSFLPFLATVANDMGGAAVGRVKGRVSGAEGGGGAVAGSMKDIGVGVSGRDVHQQKVYSSSCASDAQDAQDGQDVNSHSGYDVDLTPRPEDWLKVPLRPDNVLKRTLRPVRPDVFRR